MLGSIYAMVAVALTLSIGVLRFLNFSIPALFMIGGMMTWALVRAGVPWPLAAVAALLVGAAASLVVELFTWRRMRMAEHFVPGFLFLWWRFYPIGPWDRCFRFR